MLIITQRGEQQKNGSDMVFDVINYIVIQGLPLSETTHESI